MKKFLPILMLCGVMSGYAQVTPPHAASTKTWVIKSPNGSIKQTWSDAIHIPACNKEDFDVGTEDSPKADCRSYTFEGSTCYYYTWHYVDGAADELCPAPWSVPTMEDFVSLQLAFDAPEQILEIMDEEFVKDKYIAAWGGVYGGNANSTSVLNHGSRAFYWSSSEGDPNDAYLLHYDASGNVHCQIMGDVRIGAQVRCVK